MLQLAPDAMFFTAVLPDGKMMEFSFGEYLAWRTHMDIPIRKKNYPDEIAWLEATDNHLGRINCWLSVQQFRKDHPTNPAVKKFKETHD